MQTHWDYVTGARFPVPVEKWGFCGGGSTALFQLSTLGQEEPPLVPSFDYRKSSISSDSIIYRQILLLVLKGQFNALI